MIAIFGSLLTAPARAAEKGAARRPNILMIFCDDHAYQAISAYRSVSAYGLKLNETPNIDRLAQEGIRFDNCFVTNSICGPCRAVIQTGKYSHLNGFCCNGNRFDGTQQTFPKLLQKAGYQTAVIGKWHLGQHMTPQGYDYSEVLIGQGPYYNPPMLRGGQRVQHTGYTTEIITDLALSWLKDKRDASKPFLLMCQHKAPHRNWQPGPGYLNLYDDVTIPEPDTLFDDYSGRGTPAKTQDMTIVRTMNDSDLKLVAPRNLTPDQLEAWNKAYDPKNEAFRKANLQGRDLVRWKYQRYMKDYLRCIAAVDDNVGRILRYLDDSGLADSTVVVYSSDQGFYLGEHGWFDKRWIYEESLRTPLLVRWPGVVKPGSTNRDIVSNLDFAETFLDIAGADVPDDMQGRSFVPLLRGRTPADWRKAFYYQYYEYPAVHSVRRHYGVATDRYRLVHFYPNPWDPNPIDEWEMYDVESDPKQMHSIYGDPRHVEVQNELEQELGRLRRELQVPEIDPPASARGPARRESAAPRRVTSQPNGS
ncbi:MAG: sulfatase [Pirellulales bacterium]|nr:sulfatase [Pirellulales bacterium]